MPAWPLTTTAPLVTAPCGSVQKPFIPAASSSAVCKIQQCAQSRKRSLCSLPSLRRQRQCRVSAAASTGSDPFAAAGSRLQSLLAGTGDGEEELLESYIESSAPALKISLSLLAGGAVTCGALALCWLTGSDPWGGASVSWHSATAATIGAAACAPLLMLRAFMWTEEAHIRYPVLDALQQWEAESAGPIVRNMTTEQLAVLVCCEVLPTTLMLLPAVQGSLTVSFQIYADHLQTLGLHIPGAGAQFAALGITALLAAFARLLEHAVTPEEHDVVATAVENADRYYRVMANNISSVPQDPASAATAFKAVASQWLQQRQHACSALAVMTATEILFLGLLWRLTNDMAAPTTAAMLLTAVEYAFVKKLVDSKVK